MKADHVSKKQQLCIGKEVLTAIMLLGHARTMMNRLRVYSDRSVEQRLAIDAYKATLEVREQTLQRIARKAKYLSFRNRIQIYLNSRKLALQSPKEKHSLDARVNLSCRIEALSYQFRTRNLKRIETAAKLHPDTEWIANFIPFLAASEEISWDTFISKWIQLEKVNSKPSNLPSLLRTGIP